MESADRSYVVEMAVRRVFLCQFTKYKLFLIS